MTFTEQRVFMQSSVYKQTLLVQNGSIVRCIAHVLTTGGTRQKAEENFLQGGEGGEGRVVVGGGGVNDCGPEQKGRAQHTWKNI